MKVYIQHVETGLYLKDGTEWVEHESASRVFKGSLEAIDFCLEHKLSEVTIVLRFGEPRFDIRLRPFVRKKRANRTVKPPV